MGNYIFLRRYILFTLLFLVTFQNSQAQNYTASDSLEISLITCGVGTSAVYQAFGHTGVRIKNFTQYTDYVYNYGMFNFFEEGFIFKFIRGKLLYFVEPETFSDFMQDYLYYGRSVREQILNLDNQQKYHLAQALEVNALPENKYYHYDFIYDNCSTRPRNLIVQSIGQDFHFKVLKTANTETIREMVDRHMKYNEWLDFGIDLLLGVRFDKVADTKTRMFLPKELMIEFDSSTYHNKPIVSSSKIIYSGFEQDTSRATSPDLILWLLVIAVLIIQICIKGSALKQIIASSLLTIAGIVGWILTFMWVGTDHYMTKWNLNLLWAIPFYFPCIFLLHVGRLSSFIQKAFKMFRIVAILLLVGWGLNPQQFHSAVIPILFLIIWSLGTITKE